MNWNNISTLNFQKYAKTLKEKPESELERVQLLIKQNAILLGVTEYEAKKIPLGELQSVKNLLTTPIPQKIYETFKLHGLWYEVIMNPKELTAERFAGVQEAAKNDDLALAMYYICRPFKLGFLRRKYFEFKESEIPERVKGFNDLPVTITYPITSFFLKTRSEFTDYFLTSSIEISKRMREEVLEDYKEYMDGLRQSKRLVND
jgi:hypothetical protein